MYLCLPLTKQIIMLTFAAIDFETANKQRSSVCSVGIVWVNDGEITDSFYSLIHPVPQLLQLLVYSCAWSIEIGYGRFRHFRSDMADT